MAVQSTYSDNIAVAVNGQVADMRLTEILSRECEDDTLGFGLAVVQGTGADQVKVGAAGTFIGITVKDVTLAPGQSDLYNKGDTVAVLTRGSIWVTTSGIVTAGSKVYRTATGTLNATATDNTEIVGALWETSAGSSALARLSLK